MRIIAELEGKKFTFDVRGSRGRMPNNQEQDMIREYFHKMESYKSVLDKAEQYDLLVEAHEAELEAKDAALYKMSERCNELTAKVETLNSVVDHYKDVAEDLQSKNDEIVAGRNGWAWLWFGVSLVLSIALIAFTYGE